MLDSLLIKNEKFDQTDYWNVVLNTEWDGWFGPQNLPKVAEKLMFFLYFLSIF